MKMVEKKKIQWLKYLLSTCAASAQPLCAPHRTPVVASSHALASSPTPAPYTCRAAEPTPSWQQPPQAISSVILLAGRMHQPGLQPGECMFRIRRLFDSRLPHAMYLWSNRPATLPATLNILRCSAACSCQLSHALAKHLRHVKRR